MGRKDKATAMPRENGATAIPRENRATTIHREDGVAVLPGIGEKRAGQLASMGIRTVEDLLSHFPRDYDDRSQVKTVSSLIPGAVNTIRGHVVGEGENIVYTRDGKRNSKYAKPLIVTKLRLRDHTGELEIVWFNQPYLKKYFSKAHAYMFTGPVTFAYNRLQMTSPDYERLDGGEALSGGRIVPIYTTVSPLSQKMFRSIIKAALDALQTGRQDGRCDSRQDSRQDNRQDDRQDDRQDSRQDDRRNSRQDDRIDGRIDGRIDEQHLSLRDNWNDDLPGALRQHYALCGRETAIQHIHFPGSDDLFYAARRRLVFEELFFMQLALLHMKGDISDEPGVVFEDTNYAPLTERLPFALTGAQCRTLETLAADVRSGRRMNRLIQGDVGSGKTAVAMAAAYLAVKNGRQAAVMAPTEVLAEQHYRQFTRYLAPLGIETVLLTGSIPKKERTAAFKAMAEGRAGVTVGTHALIQSGVVYADLALVVTDEQHRFGVNQRLNLIEKGRKPHTLVMTATPIPRTLALILYGDLDISIIDEMPPGRLPIKTYCVDTGYRRRLYAFLRKEVEQGRQAYIICPAIEPAADNDRINRTTTDCGTIDCGTTDCETIDCETADLPPQPPSKKAVTYVTRYTRELAEALPGLRIGMLHGRMKPAEKQQIMTDFAANKISLLVATTVIEVGVDVPNATVMIIENADRFGLSQLHQLRGRVGRGQTQSYCVLVTDSKNEQTRLRMRAMTQTTDGFKLSELDLEQRGAGDFFGVRQHGLPSFTIANLYRDTDILKEAQTAAVAAFKAPVGSTSEEILRLQNRVRSVLFHAGGIVSL